MNNGKCGKGWESGVGGKCVRKRRRGMALNEKIGMGLAATGVGLVGLSAFGAYRENKQREARVKAAQNAGVSASKIQPPKIKLSDNLKDRAKKLTDEFPEMLERERQSIKERSRQSQGVSPQSPSNETPVLPTRKESPADRAYARHQEALEKKRSRHPARKKQFQRTQGRGLKNKARSQMRSKGLLRIESPDATRYTVKARRNAQRWAEEDRLRAQDGERKDSLRLDRQSLVSAIGKGGWGGKYTSPGKRALLAGGAIAGVVGLAALKKHRSKQKASEEKSVPLPKLRERLDARNKVNGQCGKGWTEGPGDKCIRPKGKFDLNYGQKEPGIRGAVRHFAKKAIFGSGDVEYNRQKSAGASRSQAFGAGVLEGLKGGLQDQIMGGGGLVPFGNVLPGGKIGGAVYRRSRDAGQSRIRAGAKGLAAGLSVNVPLSIAAMKGLEKLREEMYRRQQQEAGGYSEKFAKAKRREAVTEESLRKSRKKQQRKNHPDRVSKLQEPAEWERRNQKAQKVEHSFSKASKKLGLNLDSLTRSRLRAILARQWSNT